MHDWDVRAVPRRAVPQGLAFLAKELFRQRFSAAAMSLAAEGLARGMAPDAALAVYIIEQLCKKGLGVRRLHSDGGRGGR